MTRRLALPLMLAALGGCDRRPDDVPVVVSVVGAAPGARAARPGDPIGGPAAVLATATAQGLVRFDAAGQVEPGLAERWIVIDGGQSYIFRLRDAEWQSGARVTARQVVRALTRAIDNPRNPLRPHLSAIDEVVEMTPLVIEVRLSRPRPDLLPLFAQPELAVAGPDGAGGSGPFRVQEAGRQGVLLRPGYDPTRLDNGGADEPDPAEFVRLRGERAAAAILRFRRRESDLVTGGGFIDWPLVELADAAPANRRLDPARGLFGLAFVRRTGFLSGSEGREAVAMALDRPALTQAFAREWTPAESVLPERLDSAAAPVRPGWTAFDLDARRAAAQVRVARWREANGRAPEVTVALPAGPGAARLAARLTADLETVGILARRARRGERADLALVDAVAPYDSARWYLRAACQPCAAPVAALLEQARASGDLAERSRLLAEADAALARDAAFVPLAQPLRWSLVALRLRAWRGNARAWHPLNHLRRETN